ncbi:hypothetical protein AC1031_016248 [Aphanomyces cochlioides]|nr:hypothetical protein AC1031_016248 [Aphanomyces cochlioides]
MSAGSMCAMRIQFEKTYINLERSAQEAMCSIHVDMMRVNHQYTLQKPPTHLCAWRNLRSNNPEAVKAHAKAFDILLVTSYSKDTVLNHLLALTATNGKLVLVGLPEKPISFFPFSVVSRQVTFVGSTIGSPAELEEMLAFAVARGVNSIVEVMPMNEAAKALHKVRDGNVRFRIVLKN